MNSFIRRIVNWLCEKKVVSEEDYNIFLFGTEKVVLFSLTLLSLLVLGGLFHFLFETLVFTIAFVMVRHYLGGYHAKSRISCYGLSVLMYLVIFFASKVISENEFEYLTIVCVVLSLLIVQLIDIGEKNSEKGVCNLRFQGKLLLYLEACISIIGVYIGNNLMTYFLVASAMLFASVSYAIKKVDLKS